ncbi:hypothetical protein K3727_17195 [Rhodobacteraceae bacterium M382]|nr:hypothetical protein K3727_17180 [Rhodobacteraceae bacterium M382]UWQ90486.1 hypothetical protein K3727_17195 [Rhodobacteraceae bacterium M382]
MIHFVQHLLRSERHDSVAVLLCVSRLEEIERLVEEMNLNRADFAVLTSDEEVNLLSSVPPSEARVLFTTHAMVMSRCRSSFRDAVIFQYQGQVRAVRVWDEAMLRNEVVSLNTDQLASLRDPLRFLHPALVELIERLEGELETSGGQGICTWPDVEETTGVSLLSARRGLEQRHASYLDALYTLSGRCVLLRKPNNASTVITALDSRDAIPDDLAPMVILDASGRVRATYELWEEHLGNLVRLPSAAKSYGNLTVHVMDKGSGKNAWLKNGEALAREVAQLIDSKPEEQWLVVYHKGVKNGAIPDQIRGLLSSNPDRARFLNWGKHQGTNEYRHIQNVILAGMNNHPETDYEVKARYYCGIANDSEFSKTLVEEMAAGEHMHHILQALCRSAVRLGSGSECGPCNAYIIAPKRSGIRKLLPKVFPGCEIRAWKPSKSKPKGKVQEALTYIERFFDGYPEGTLPFTKLRSTLGYDASNFRRRIRNHETFKAGLADMGVAEVTTGKTECRNAFTMTWGGIGFVDDSCFIADV